MSQSLSKIQEYLVDSTGKIQLTDEEHEFYKRTEFAFQCIMHYKTKSKAVGPIMKGLRLTSRQGAYKLIKAAEFLWGNFEETSKGLKREIATNMAVKLFDIAMQNQDIDQANKALANYIKANALQLDDPDLPDFSKIQPPEQPIIIDLEFLNQFKETLGIEIFDQVKEVFEKSKIFHYIPKDAIDIDFEDVK